MLLSFKFLYFASLVYVLQRVTSTSVGSFKQLAGIFQAKLRLENSGVSAVCPPKGMPFYHGFL